MTTFSASPIPINSNIIRENGVHYDPIDFSSKLNLPSTPPPDSLKEGPPVVSQLTTANRPIRIIPNPAPLPPIHSGSIMENFEIALKAIDLDECDAHGENAFFVCDLAQVYKQHMRWTKELGDRVEAFFGRSLSAIMLIPELAIVREY